MPGVGLVLACKLIALLPELSRMSRKQVAALVGVAPYAFESGKFKGRKEGEKVAAENASRLLEDAMLQRLSRRIRRLAADIDMLDRHLAEIVGADAALAHRYRPLTSMHVTNRCATAPDATSLLSALTGSTKRGRGARHQRHSSVDPPAPTKMKIVPENGSLEVSTIWSTIYATPHLECGPHRADQVARKVGAENRLQPKPH
jgi:Transposase IS116/IS110/IS902 family